MNGSTLHLKYKLNDKLYQRIVDKKPLIATVQIGVEATIKEQSVYTMPRVDKQ